MLFATKYAWESWNWNSLGSSPNRVLWKVVKLVLRYVNKQKVVKDQTLNKGSKRRQKRLAVVWTLIEHLVPSRGGQVMANLAFLANGGSSAKRRQTKETSLKPSSLAIRPVAVRTAWNWWSLILALTSAASICWPDRCLSVKDFRGLPAPERSGNGLTIGGGTSVSRYS